MRRVGLSDVANVVLLACVIAATARLFWQTPVQPTALPATDGKAVASDVWQTMVSRGARSGSAAAPDTVVILSDFECPACRGFAVRVLPSLRMSKSVLVVYHHFPLPYHRFAVPAAEAAECAGEQGRFWEFSELVFARHDSLGLLPFDEIAARAGVRSVPEFANCVRSHRYRERVEEDRDLALEIGALGTPTVVHNGRFSAEWHDSTRVARLLGKSDR